MAKSQDNKKEPKSISQIANLQFPVDRIARYMKDKGYANTIGEFAPVYLTAILEYLTAEMIELAGQEAKDENKQQKKQAGDDTKNNKIRINPQHIVMAVKKDDELSIILRNTTFSMATHVKKVCI